MMKVKHLLQTVALGLTVCLCLLWSGCMDALFHLNSSNDSPVGIYKIYSVTMDNVTHQVGDTFDGDTLTEDSIKFILAEDGTAILFTIRNNRLNAGIVGTWTQKDSTHIEMIGGTRLSDMDNQYMIEYDETSLTLEWDTRKLSFKKYIPESSSHSAAGTYKFYNIILTEIYGDRTSTVGPGDEYCWETLSEDSYKFILREDGTGLFVMTLYNHLGALADLEVRLVTWTQKDLKHIEMMIHEETDVLLFEYDGTFLTYEYPSDECMTKMTLKKYTPAQ